MYTELIPFQKSDDHIADIGKMVDLGSDSYREIDDTCVNYPAG
jgi:hypothetical protein